jgi:hypothetical protein
VLEVVRQRLGWSDGLTPKTVKTGIDDNSVQPGRDGRVAAELVGAAEGGDHRVLKGVRRLLGIPGRSQGDGPQAIAMP